MLRDLVLKNRSFRQFYQEEKITREVLMDLIDLARFTGSGGNAQPLKYILAHDEEINNLIFPHLVWAKSLKDWDGPREGEKPTGYIIVLGNSKIKNNYEGDLGIACQTILLGAVEMGLGGCMIRDIKRSKLREVLNIDESYKILIAIALGKPRHQSFIEEVPPSGDIKYWKDKEGHFHVPKRPLDELIVK